MSELHFVKHVLERGGEIKPLLIDPELTNGTGLCNPSVLVYNDTIIVNIRHVQYTIYHSETRKYEHQWGPLLYLNPNNDNTLTTVNYIALLDENLDIKTAKAVDTSKLDKPPLWEFVGLEDGRLVDWNNKLYLTGVRRDLDTIGTGRMELSRIENINQEVVEVDRFRIPAPGADNSYCEKNWMPFRDLPFHYVKWTNPTEIVKVDPIKGTCDSIFQGEYAEREFALRGGSQVLPYGDGYIALNHETDLYRSDAGRKDATYRHRFTIWNKDFTVRKHSKLFTFLTTKLEFSCGMDEYRGDYLITFGAQDNAAYILRVPAQVFHDFVEEDE